MKAPWFRLLLTVLAVSVMAAPGIAQEAGDEAAEEESRIDAGLVSAIKMRNIGPAFMSGRITEIAVDPTDRATWYVSAASGNVWKTTNAGTTWTPIFDRYGSYSIGTVAIDPNNHLTVWVGTGENNSQRSVGYGDGIYKSLDGGRSFKKTGLDDSQHIARILIDPRDSDRIFVAAQGPLWSSGGDRGVYMSDNGGDNWHHVLEISDDTGVSDLVFAPDDPDTLYASAYQRRRHVWTLLDGGPESGVYKSTDGGQTWREINKGLPGGDKGRIGLAVSPLEPDVVYAIVEAAEGRGFFRSTDRGENWSRRSNYVTGSPQYYQEIYADPHVYGRIYALDTLFMVSEDDGASFHGVGEDNKHVDNHAIWIDPDNPDHILNGNDGGLYETWDRGATYRFFANLPIAQYYKLAVGNDGPFYTVCGGTQDNATHCGPKATNNVHGIRNSDWFVTVFGDGFDSAIDPEDANIIYSQWQHGGLIRFDRATGERIDIKPRESAEGPPLRWNWDSPLLISPHSNTRLYFGAQQLFRTDDRGNTWEAISPDLTRDMDRNRLEIMGRVWGPDAVRKNASTSLYGTLVSLDESPVIEGLLYTGSDDGLMHVSEDGGGTWRQTESFPGVPDRTYINDIEASLHDGNTVYAAFNNHKMGDFAPYVLKSDDRGASWTPIADGLPERGSVYTLEQDHVNPDLLFAGTEFGVYFTVDGGDNWHKVAGVPTIGIRELEVQRAETDLVAASFGRGFYVLDDYSPLRDLTEELLEADAHIFPVKPALAYIQAAPLALSGKAFQGASFYTADNPPFGATFTYYLKNSLESRQQQRRARDRELAKEGEDVFYPTWEEFKAEDREESPEVFLTVRDQDGNVVRNIEGSTSEGIHRETWNLRYPGFTPARAGNDGFGPMAVPGTYTVELSRRVDGVVERLVEPLPFTVQPLGMPTLAVGDRDAILAFQKQTGALQRAVMGASSAASDAAERIELIKDLVSRAPNAPPELRAEARALELRLMDLRETFGGDPTRRRRREAAMPGITSRLQQIVGGHWSSTSPPTATHRAQYDIVAAEFEAVLGDLTQLIEVDLVALEDQLEAAGLPWTRGRKLPRWQRQ